MWVRALLQVVVNHEPAVLDRLGFRRGPEGRMIYKGFVSFYSYLTD